MVRVVGGKKEDREEMMVMAQFFLLCIEFSSILTGVFLSVRDPRLTPYGAYNGCNENLQDVVSNSSH